MGWNSAVLIDKVVLVGEFSLTIELCSELCKLLWRCTSVYGPVDRSRKSTFWEEL